MKFEQDEVELLGGVRHGLTLGSPIAIRIGNTEWPKWSDVMSADPVDADALAAADDVNAEKEVARNRPLTRPRPGHADLVGMQKYGFDDARPVLERARARETAARVALGAVAAAFLEQASASGWCPTPSSIGPARGRRRRAAADRRRRRRARRRSAALLRRGDVRRDGRRGRRRAPGRRHPRRRRRGARLRPAAGTRLARALGPPARRAARRRADGHPGDQGRRGRRRLPHRRAAAARRRTTSSSGAPTASSAAAPTGPVAPRAACAPATLLRVRAAMKPISTVPHALRHGRRRDR